ncbi:hypothetical protein BGZ46_006106 [Entomortierella lignicola]|nr:hypothetical protein BGZ46_006106 [Entomortierella lignicola]
MKSTAILALAALASVATADLISYSEPVAATTWDLSTGNAFTVSWTGGCDSNDTKTYDITLNVQTNGLQVPVGIPAIGQLDCAEQSGSTSVTVPSTVASGNLYSVLVNNNVLSYSALFTIVNPAVPASNSTTATVTGTAVASTTAAATTVASSSTAVANSTTLATVTATTATAKPTATNAAGALKVGSTAALVIAAAVGLMF